MLITEQLIEVKDQTFVDGVDHLDLIVQEQAGEELPFCVHEVHLKELARFKNLDEAIYYVDTLTDFKNA